MNKSESISELTSALVKVQTALKPAAKDSQNPFFKTAYADLNSIWDSCRELLGQNGLAVIQTTAPVENAVVIETMLAHTSGEWISGELYLPLVKQDPQGVGSAITYGRRYGLAAIVGVVADVDDDGESHRGNGQKKPQAAPKPKAMAATVGGRNDPQAPIATGYGKGRPETGKAADKPQEISTVQLELLQRKCDEKGVDINEYASQEFLDVSHAKELSKAAATWLISTLNK